VSHAPICNRALGRGDVGGAWTNFVNSGTTSAPHQLRGANFNSRAPAPDIFKPRDITPSDVGAAGMRLATGVATSAKAATAAVAFPCSSDMPA
jgi:hypothetical protein